MKATTSPRKRGTLRSRGRTGEQPRVRLSSEAAQFYGRIYPAARAGCCHELRLLGCSEDEAEELFMASIERVMRTVDPIAREFDPGQMVNLLKVACKRRLIDEHRHRGVLTEICLDDVGSLSDPSAIAPDDAVEDRETIDAAREAIACLPQSDQMIFCKRNQLGLSPEEIQSSVPGLSPRAYRRAIQRSNAKVFTSFEQIESGERCRAIRHSLLEMEIAGADTPEISQVVKAHLGHCRGCRRIRTLMLRRVSRSEAR